MQEDLREELQEYVKRKGVKYAYIAKQIKISKSMLSHFLHFRRSLNKDTLKLLEQVLKNCN